MKHITTFKTLFFISLFFAIVNFSYAQNTISGTVRYSDDNSLVTSGIVKAFDLNGSFIAQGNINPDGTYAITGLAGTQYDIIGFPGTDPINDFPPTGFPSAINPANMVPVLVVGTVINIDIYVTRVTAGGGNRYSASITGKITQKDRSIQNAVIYVTSGSSIFGYGISNADGSYKINNVPLGDYIIIVHRIGEKSDTKNVSLGNSGLDNVNFNLAPVVKTLNTVTTTPVQFKLSQNYPNPFNPSTVINYVVPKDGNVSLKVYNSLGELVSSLVNSDQKAGAYSVIFDGANLSSGIYFYTLKTGSNVDTKRMVLIK